MIDEQVAAPCSGATFAVPHITFNVEFLCRLVCEKWLFMSDDDLVPCDICLKLRSL